MKTTLGYLVADNFARPSLVHMPGSAWEAGVFYCDSWILARLLSTFPIDAAVHGLMWLAAALSSFIPSAWSRLCSSVCAVRMRSTAGRPGLVRAFLFGSSW